MNGNAWIDERPLRPEWFSKAARWRRRYGRGQNASRRATSRPHASLKRVYVNPCSIGSKASFWRAASTAAAGLCA
jgi:hypothetical protein